VARGFSDGKPVFSDAAAQFSVFALNVKRSPPVYFFTFHLSLFAFLSYLCSLKECVPTLSKVFMKKILILNGPNLNLLGRREPTVYGHRSFDDYLAELRRQFEGRAELSYFQSNHEGDLIDRLHEVGFGEVDGVVLNAGAYTHTSVALHDAIRAIEVPVVEVHISNVHQREEFRHHSMISAACRGVICGFGLDSYRLAIESMV
jgi:3-dehydroquinate dehydratase-2